MVILSSPLERRIILLVRGLLERTPRKDRCKYLGISKFEGEEYAYCSNLEGRPEDAAQDTASLQLWCLDKQKCKRCIYYK